MEIIDGKNCNYNYIRFMAMLEFNGFYFPPKTQVKVKNYNLVTKILKI